MSQTALPPAFLAVDWGTTNRRCYAIDADGGVIATDRDARGILSVPAGGFPAEVAAMRDRFGDVPVLCAGMVGSTRGWVEAPYVACPATLADLAASLIWAEPGRTAIVPGVKDDAPDVMRGEEVQLLGAVAAGLAPSDALLCQPGTHSKWAMIANGAITGFRTAMTGELFALLRDRSLLTDFMTGPVDDGPAFHDGLALADRGTPLTSLFGERAGAVLGRNAAADVAARVSGLLIGSDVRERSLAPGATVHILAEPGLAALYAAAVRHAGGTPVAVDSHAAFLAGITAIWRLAA
ncbi:2-dehydro-3-deoxygalactonokinase [Sphingomonas mollis]|uniref:2-dehydro-3-deoxygalactonokinase n=1 Tax=Sphingomonas mollis TaxID=2795726 RepID=UPI003A101DB3